MFKFNSDHILAGYIKQLLASFNLPTYRIYTRENQEYFDKYGKESPDIIYTLTREDGSIQTLTRYIPYIKDGAIQEYVCDATTKSHAHAWKYITHYSKNNKILNNTKTLKIKNNIYDVYTHEYLGEYLRFLRDYDNVDLMPLYNCFSNNLCSNIALECDHTDANGKVISHFSFNSSQTNYKIFMLPVKLFKEYTIAIDCNSAVEVCCGVYGKYQDTDKLFTSISHDTYKKYSNMRFNAPILYTPLKDMYNYLDENTKIRLAQREDDLKLFIKLPADNKSSIVVLEGNYLKWNDAYVELYNTTKNNNYIFTNTNQYRNHAITNYADEGRSGATHRIISDENYSKYRKFVPISPLQLLSINTGTSYPFANSLIEYLFDNVITPMDDISDNIKRVQTVIAAKTAGKITHPGSDGTPDGLWDSRTRAIIYDQLQGLQPKKQAGVESWLDTYKNTKQSYKNIVDNLGYVTHIAEQAYNANINGENVSIANVDIYPDLYKDQKE